VYKDEFEIKLPPSPPANMQPGIEVTELTFTVWDLNRNGEITAVAFLKGEDGTFTVWTPGQLSHWVWRGPVCVSRVNMELFVTWLRIPRLDENSKSEQNAIRLWDSDPGRECSLNVRKLHDGSFDLSMMMAGLRRGGASMGSEDAHLLGKWLIQKI
jgi:hypothetical protein